MNNKTRLVFQAGFAITLAAGLSACGSGGSAPTPTPSQTTSARFEDQFGIAFGNDFRASPNGEPSPVADGDLIAISLTDEPKPVN